MIYPKKGDVIVIDAEPHSGREYGGHDPKRGNIRRHMVVLSSDEYNTATGMIVGMPITTSEQKGKPMFLPILINGDKNTGVKGNIVMWQMQNFDFSKRRGTIVNRIDKKTLKQLESVAKDILGLL